MVRPVDTYAHSQFTPCDPSEWNPKSSTVRCNHCKVWTGVDRSLDRKKWHLGRCAQYGEWRAAGNGQELAPSHFYRKSGRFQKKRPRTSEPVDEEENQEE